MIADLFGQIKHAITISSTLFMHLPFRKITRARLGHITIASLLCGLLKLQFQAEALHAREQKQYDTDNLYLRFWTKSLETVR